MEDQTQGENQSELIKSLIETTQAQKQQIDMLLQVADKKALGNYYARNQKDLPKTVRLNELDGKVIMSWAMVKNEVYKDSITLRWIEMQVVALTFEDGTTLELPYTDYVRRYIQEDAKILSRTNDEITGKLKLKVARLSDGKEYEIGVEYIN